MESGTRNLLFVLGGVGVFYLWKQRQASDAERAGLSAVGAGATPRAGSTPRSSSGAVSQTPVGVAPNRLLSMREAFHLRPTATAESVGPELPAGTEVEVGLPTSITRTTAGRTERLFAVYLADGRRGYAFLQPDVWPRFMPPENTENLFSSQPTTPTQNYSSAKPSYSGAKPLSGWEPQRAIAGEGRYARRY